MKKIKETIPDIIFYCTIILILFLLRYKTIFLMYQDWDEAAMMSESWAMTKGQILYKDIYHVHPIFQFFIFIPFFVLLPNSIAPHAIKAMNILLIFGGALLIKRLTTKTLHNHITGYFSALLFTFYLSYFSWTHSSYGEFYALFPILIAANLMLTQSIPSKTCMILAGIMCGAAFFIKQVAIFDIISLLIFLLLFQKKIRLKNLFLNFTIGFFISSSIAFIYPAFHGIIFESVQSMFFHNIKSYIGTKSTIPFYLKIPSLCFKTLYLIRNHFNLVFKNLSVKIFFGLPLLISLMFLFPKKLLNKKNDYNWEQPKLFICCLIWFLMIFLGLAAIGRFYTHYFIQIAIPGIFLLSIFFNNIPSKPRVIYLIITSLFLIYSGYINYDHNFKGNDPTPKQIKKSKAVSDFIKANSNEKETLFLFKVFDLNLFYLSERLSPNGIYMFSDMDASHTGNIKGEEKHKKQIIKTPPHILITGPLPTNTKSTLEIFFQNLINEHYTFQKKLYDLNIYFLKRT